jgi:uncharacterized protein with HEPN domain
MRRERSADLLQDILDFIDRIESWTPAEAAVDADEKTLYAVLHALQYIGEAVSRLPNDITDLAPEVPWAATAGVARGRRDDLATSYERLTSTPPGSRRRRR